MSESGATVVRLPNRQKVRDEAGLWLSRLDRGLTERERLDLESWLAEDPQHRDILLKLAILWDQTGVLSELAELFPLTRPKRVRLLTRSWAVAAAGLAAAAVVAALVIDWGALERGPTPEAWQAYETAVGGQSTVGLVDGSTVTLNTNSAIEVLYTDTERTVRLSRGEGYFSVEHDPERPFRVHAGGRVFEAVGTAFNVRLETASDVTMMVTEGRVGVFPSPVAGAAPAATSTAAIVDAGSLAIVGERGVSIQALAAAEMEAQLSWQQGMLIFDGDPLEAVLREMGRYTTTEILADESVRDVRVGGYFRAGDVEGLLIALRENFDIESARGGDGRIFLTAAR